MVLEKTLESPLDCKQIQSAYPKGNHCWIFIGRTDAEAETPILWTPDVKNCLIGKDSGKDWKLEKKEATEDEMVGWHHWLNGHEFEQALGVCDAQEKVVSCSPWGCKESDTTEWLYWKNMLIKLIFVKEKKERKKKFLSVNIPQTITLCTLNLQCYS